ncbi:hypothetical protein CXG81DRAFT_16820 [Caulochytrium protostelioides]|uniref:Aminomethyltransferase folate-binding domain-containing protein n=1 Tax=Caulochytrium protostelioides TaxID=1555241 RepID=A0A4P9XDX1_9FUNG|nr:hypothetical protein CXG81DRAFT_16820 [Caulochytrium protostelioides]|eukprot:RKP03724.1 hypothetical protein CXG81DRAFT_16820 [Caulochytrium protostelioides]
MASHRLTLSVMPRSLRPLVSLARPSRPRSVWSDPVRGLHTSAAAAAGPSHLDPAARERADAYARGRFPWFTSPTPAAALLADLTATPHPSAAAHADTARYLLVRGAGAAGYLQGMVTKDMAAFTGDAAVAATPHGPVAAVRPRGGGDAATVTAAARRPSLVHTAFLQANGRVVFDAMVWRLTPSQVAQTGAPPPSLAKPKRKLVVPVAAAAAPAAVKASVAHAAAPPPRPDAAHTEAFLIEVHRDIVETAERHLRQYVLRAQVAIQRLDTLASSDGSSAGPQIASYQVWGPMPPLSPATASSSSSWLMEDDPRHASLGRRVLLLGPPPRAPDIPVALAAIVQTTQVTPVPVSAYHLLRILLGIPEGPSDLPPSQALPLEHALDAMRSIDWRKGCYLGQELTVRTHHTGVVRKRIVPIAWHAANTAGAARPDDLVVDPDPKLHGALVPHQSLVPYTSDAAAAPVAAPAGSPRRPRPASAPGRAGSGILNVGIALMRLPGHVLTDPGETPTPGRTPTAASPAAGSPAAMPATTAEAGPTTTGSVNAPADVPYQRLLHDAARLSSDPDAYVVDYAIPAWHPRT